MSISKTNDNTTQHNTTQHNTTQHNTTQHNTTQQDCKTNNRSLGIDLFKIILAFMVLTIHINAGGTGQVLKHAFVKPWAYIFNIVTILCYPAVNCYILITGYFSSMSKKSISKTAKSLVNLWSSLFFFSVVGYLIVTVLQFTDYSILELFKRFIPLTRQTWWFFNVYFTIMCISPFLNKFIEALTKKEHQILLGISLVFCSIQPYIVNWQDKLGVNYGNSLIWFIVLYITGAYIRNYPNNTTSKKQFVKYICLSAATFLLAPILTRLGVKIQLATYNSLLIYFQSIALFKTFLYFTPPQWIIPGINSFAQLSLASYLFHCQEDIKGILWSNLKIYDFANTYLIIPVAIILCLLLYFISILLEGGLDFIKKQTNFDKKINNWINNLASKFS